VDRLLRWLTVARGAYLPLIVTPILLGTAYALYDAYPMRWMTFALAMIGGMALFLCAMVIVAVLELIQGHEPIAERTAPLRSQGAEIMAGGLVSLPEAAAVGAATLVAALACGALLARPAGSFAIGLGFGGLLLAIFYAVPGIGFRDLGHGTSELGAFLALGPLPVLGGYAAQSGSFTVGSVLASMPLGLYGAAIAYSHDLHRFSRDPDGEGSSLIMDLGDERALIGAWALPGLAYVAIVLNVVLGDYPASTCWALATFPVMAWKLTRLDAADPETVADLTRTTAILYALTGLILAGAIVVSGARAP
jgi:1,4-dihydroxy-2-naphthoate octaprenyltransferase